MLEQILSLNELHGKPYEPFFWRTAQGEEVDLILQSSKTLIPIEIKSYPNVDFKNLKGIASFAESFSVKGLVIVPEGPAYKLGPGISVCSLMEGLQKLF